MNYQTLNELRFLIVQQSQEKKALPVSFPIALSKGWIDGDGKITELGTRTIDYALKTGVQFTDDQAYTGRPFEFVEPANTLQQDLFLLAKNHYGHNIPFIQAAVLICSQHIRMRPEHFDKAAVIHWLMTEFAEPGLILTTPERMKTVFLNAGKFPYTHRSFYSTMVDTLLDEISCIKPFNDDGSSRLPFEVPKPDPAILEMLK